MTNRHELRLKLQAIGLNADLRQAYRVDPAGNAIPTDEPVDDFSVRNLGLQIRYRYELAPLSYLYVVYGRGGFDQDAVADELGPAVPRQLQPARRRAVAGQAQLSVRDVRKISRQDAKLAKSPVLNFRMLLCIAGCRIPAVPFVIKTGR